MKENNCHTKPHSGEESREQKSLCRYTGSFTLFGMKAYFLLRHKGCRGRQPLHSYRHFSVLVVGAGAPTAHMLDPGGSRKKRTTLKPGKMLPLHKRGFAPTMRFY